MKKLTKLLTTILLILIFIERPIQIFAQTPTITPEATGDTIQLNPLSGLNTNVDLSASASSSILDKEITPDFITNEQNNISANFRPPINVRRLAKSSYQAKEKIEIVISNASATDDLGIEIKNERSAPIKAHIEKKFINGEFIFSINPEVGMEPGQYTARVIDNSSGQVLSEQDFTWGVLAINTHKSIYAPGEEAKIAIAVLDARGMMVCDAQVELQITAPWGQKTLLSTIDGGIWVNRDCLLHQITERPDYEASFMTSDVGRYLMVLTATTLNGSYTVKDKFEVRGYVPFDVERNTATRIYPPETYPVSMKIKANENFRGKIVESVPQEFQISPGKTGDISYSEESVIPESYNPKTETNIPDLRLPFDGNYPVTEGFGEQLYDPTEISVYKKSGLDGHDGIDFGLPSDTPVVAVDAGKVILAQEKWIYGTSVVIEHSWGRSYYGHLSSLAVATGDNVTVGQEIGLSGSTGLSTGPHLHFGLKPKNNDINNLYYGKIDPAPFFGLANEDATLSTADYPIAAKALVWNVDVEKGAEFTIGYQYKAPNRFPYFYNIGPLQFITADIKEASNAAKFDAETNPFVLGEATSSGELNSSPSAALSLPSGSSTDPESSAQKEKVIFSEIRQWQIAADATNTVILDANADGTCGSGCWTVPSDWTDVNTIYTIGGGGAGDNTSASAGEGGGGGGAWARIYNANLTGGNNVGFNVATGGTDSVQPGAATWFCNNTTLCTGIATGNVIVSADSGTTATGVTGAAGGDLTGVGPNGELAGGAGGTGNTVTPDTTGGGGGAGSPNGTGGTGGNGDNDTAGEEPHGGGGGSGCDAIGASNNGVAGDNDGGTGGDSCFATGGAGGTGTSGSGSPGANGSGGGGGDATGSGGRGGDGVQSSDPSLAGGGGGGGDDDTGGVGGAGGCYGGGGGGGETVGAGCSGVIIITYTLIGPANNSGLMRHGKWFDATGVEKYFTF